MLPFSAPVGSVVSAHVVRGNDNAIITSLNQQRINIKDAPYSAPDDGVADGAAEIQGALDDLGPNGGIVIVPTPKVSYYCAASLQIKSTTRFVGRAVWSGATVNPGGSLIEFAPDITGIYVEGKGTNKNGIQSPARATDAAKSIIENLTLTSRGGQTGLLNGGTGVADVDALRIRTGTVQARNCYFYNWHRNGVRIWATSGSGDPTLAGNANLWQLYNVIVGATGDDGISVFGADANAGIATICDSSGSLTRGYYDGSLLGNTWLTCHASGNAGRCYETDNPNARSAFISCYVEGAGALSAAQQARILSPSMVIGGELASDGSNFTSDSTAMVITSDGRLVRKGLQHVNSKGATTVAISLGKDTATQTAMTLGSGDTTIPNEDIELIYGGTTAGVWDMRDNGSAARAFLSFPNRTLVASLRAYAPGFRNGLFFGILGGATAVHHKVGGAPPVSGTWVKADRLYNDFSGGSTGTASGIEHWYEQVAGTPGTWVANRAFGTVTLGAAAATVVSNVNVQAGSRIVVFPTNATAGTLQAGTNAVYISAKTAATSFTLTTAAGGSAVGTETFDYVIFN